MARIIARKGKKKTTFAATVPVKGYEPVSCTFDKKREARTWAAEIETEMKGCRFKDLRKVNLDRYDDRDLVHTNLIDSYDRIIAFVQKHLPDPFFWTAWSVSVFAMPFFGKLPRIF